MSDRNESIDLDWESTPGGMDVLAGEFVLVTADESDHPRYQAISALLERIRKAFGMDAVFVSQFVGDKPLVRYSTPLDDGGDAPVDMLEETFGHRMLETRPRLPRPRGASRKQINPDFVALPVTSKDGSEYGTLCSHCYTIVGAGHSSMDALRSVARLVAATLEGTDSTLSGLMPLHAHPAAPQWAHAEVAA